MNKRKTRIKNKTNYNKRRDKTKKIKGGFWFNNSKKIVPFSAATSINIELASKAKEEEKNTLANLATKSATNTAAIATAAATGTYIGYATIAGLSATGVGIPVAGALAAVLLIANTMAYMAIANSKLKTVLFDVLNIITHCNNLNKTIEIILETFKKIIIKNPLKIDPEIYDRLKEKLELLMTYLIELATEDMLKILEKDEKIQQSDSYKIIKNECQKRGIKLTLADSVSDKEKSDTIFKKPKIISQTIDASGRVLNRTVWAQYTINEVVKDLTIINGYFMLMKSQFDMIIQHYEHNIDSEQRKKIWQTIEQNDSYKTYLSLDNKTP